MNDRKTYYGVDQSTGEDYSVGVSFDVYYRDAWRMFHRGLLAGILIGAGLTCAVWMWL